MPGRNRRVVARGAFERARSLERTLTRRLALVAPALLAACTSQAEPAPPGAPLAPSVVVIVLDDVGRDDVYPSVAFTPTIERIAGHGVRFERAYSWPVCSPARYAMSFGRYPRRDGIGDVIHALQPETSSSPPPPRELVSLAEVFTPSHRTALFGKWHLGRAGLAGEMDQPTSGPFVQGFDRWLAGMPNGTARGAQGDTHYEWNRVEDGALSVSGQYATEAQYDAFVEWWTSTEGPRFAWIGLAAAHPPYDPPPGMGTLPTERGNYEQMIAYLDQEALARVADSIDLDETYVVIVGDNGTPPDARPQGTAEDHFKGTVFEGGVRVPLIIAGPNVTRFGAVSDRLVSVVDLPATILELAGMPRPTAGFEDSRSFADELSLTLAGDLAREFVFTERFTEVQDELAVIESRWKLRRVDPDGPEGPLAPLDELYDLDSDPLEGSPIAPGTGFDDVFARLRAALDSIPPRVP